MLYRVNHRTIYVKQSKNKEIQMLNMVKPKNFKCRARLQLMSLFWVGVASKLQRITRLGLAIPK